MSSCGALLGSWREAPPAGIGGGTADRAHSQAAPPRASVDKYCGESLPKLRSSSPAPSRALQEGPGPPSSCPASGQLQLHPGLPGSGDLTGFCAAPANTRDTAASIFLMERSKLTRQPRHPGTQKEWFGRPQVSLRRPEPKPRPKRSDGAATASHAAPVCRPTRMVAGDGYAHLRNTWPPIN